MAGMLVGRLVLRLSVGVAFALVGGAATACDAAKVMFGDISLDIIPAQGYETALVRNASFNTKDQNYGAFRGEITVDRGGFSIRDINQIVVGSISPKLELEGSDDSCDKRSKVLIKKVQPGTYIMMNGGTPVGTIKGRFPKNSFGVR